MKLCQLGDLASYPDAAPLTALPIWHHSVYELTELKLLAAFTRAKLNSGRETAVTAFELAAGEALTAFVLGDLEYCPLSQFQIPVEDLAVTRLSSGLLQLDPVERALILLAVAESCTPHTLELLTWEEVHARRFTQTGVQILKRQVPRLGYPFVFWYEGSDGLPCPVVDLEVQISRVFKMTWSRFEKMVHVWLRHSSIGVMDFAPYLDRLPR